MTMKTPTECHSAPLSPEQLEAFGAELDAIRNRLLSRVDESDARYIHRVISVQRLAELGGRALLLAGLLPPAWAAGVGLLALSKVLENMEIGHNVMHGQYDWTNDPSLDGARYEWDIVCPGDQWRHSHNYMHHTFTNVVGKDRDVGYGFLRVADEQPWNPTHLFQPLSAVALMLLFQWGVALHDLELDRVASGEKPARQALSDAKPIAIKAARQLLKDYVLFPVLAGPMAPFVFAGNASANVLRNVWAFLIIFCGHFPEGVYAYSEAEVAGESRPGWYLRQIRGSANIEGGRWFHILSGNLSHQIEHHLFPDVPARRYAEAAPEVQAVCRKYGIHYTTGPFGRQVASVARRIARLALPPRKVRSGVAAARAAIAAAPERVLHLADFSRRGHVAGARQQPAAPRARLE
jgi:linoleoyl-CoA desaturase